MKPALTLWLQLALVGCGALHAASGLAAQPPKQHRALQPPGLYQVEWEADPARSPHNFCVSAGKSAEQAAAQASCPDHTVKVIDAQTLAYVSNCASAHSTRTVRRVDDKTWSIHTAMTIKVDGADGAPAATAKERWTRIAPTCTP